ncbi:MAG TPA: aminotransferase class III-fold pyridoxal phosphate-dependent enzyme [Phototrophicaceae bacterium]|jgi:4-aminobutyrate aminotransferase|nr:aminotransferase class III-fold pyridoxal phosphate-dependent enzyme [Phototrophicaceae bacterium]
MAQQNTDFLSPVWSHMTSIQPVRGEGAYLYDADDNQYLDFTSGIGVTNTGHAHPRVVKAIQDQAAKLIFAQMNIVTSPVVAALAEALNDVTPPELNSFFFANSGAEAVEAAVKLARHATHRRNVIVFQGSFHGRTAQAMSMTTAKYIYRYDYQPLPAGVFTAPFPYSLTMPEDELVRFCLSQLDLILKGQSSPDETAAIVIEPVLGEGGYIPAPVSFLQALRQICTEYGIMLVFDEVQTGFGRTGKWFALEHAGVVPDILIMAKGLGSGLPISGIASRKELMQRWKTGSHGGTYGGGSVIPAAAALETVKVLREENLIENSHQMGEYLRTGLRTIQQQYPVIRDVRGLGLMVGTEFITPDGKTDKDTCKAVQNACLKRNLLLLTCGTYENIIRWIPPLVVTAEQIETALGIFADALAEVTVRELVQA